METVFWVYFKWLVFTCPCQKEEGIFFQSSPWEPGRASGSKIHKTIEAPLRMGPHDILSLNSSTPPAQRLVSYPSSSPPRRQLWHLLLINPDSLYCPLSLVSPVFELTVCLVTSVLWWISEEVRLSVCSGFLLLRRWERGLLSCSVLVLHCEVFLT